MTIKEITYGRWEQAKKTISTNTDDSLANYLLDLYFNDLLSPSGEPSSYLPHVLSSGQQSSSEANKYVSFQYFMLDTVRLNNTGTCTNGYISVSLGDILSTAYKGSCKTRNKE